MIYFIFKGWFNRGNVIVSGTMTTIWILVANASGAHIYQTTKARLLQDDTELDLVRSMEHPASREKVSALVTDKSGNFGGKHTGHGTFSEPKEAKAHEAELFAHEIASVLDDARSKNQFDTLVLVMPARFYGALNKLLSAPLKTKVDKHIDKDFTKLDRKALMTHLSDYL